MCVRSIDIFVLTEYCTKKRPSCCFPFNPFHQSNNNKMVALHRGCLLTWGEWSKLPLKQNKLLVKHNKLLVKHNKLLVKQNKLLVKHNKLLVKQNKLLVKHNKLPVKHNKLLVKHNKLPVKHNKLPVKHDNRIRWVGGRKELFEKSGMFQNFNPSNPYCEGVQGILYNYYNALQRVQLYGPTNFAPVINHVAR